MSTAITPLQRPVRSALLVDDEPAVLDAVSQIFERYGWEVTGIGDPITALAAYERIWPDLVMLDISMPGMSGLDVLDAIRRRDPDATVVMLSGQTDIPTAVESIRLGAENYLTKPIDSGHLKAVIERAYEKSQLRRRNRVLAGRQVQQSSLNTLGESPAMREVARLIGLLAPGSAPILLTGETGTGKGWVAKLIHAASPRAGAPFVSVNCAGLSPTFLESELFGHERGAFTDAKTQKAGLFEVAHGGTLLLDEIGDLAPELQPKLLTVLESQRFRRLGGTREVQVDVRLIAATHVDLASAVKEGRFRPDLYYRIVALPIHLPALRDRGADAVIELATSMLSDLKRQMGRGPTTISAEALRVIAEHAWPGNVRELRNTLERAMLVAADSATLETEHLPLELRPKRGPHPSSSLPSDLSMEAAECAHLVRVLSHTEGNRAQAAKVLKISRQTLYNRLKHHGLD